jgi:hypothetical protein
MASLYVKFYATIVILHLAKMSHKYAMAELYVDLATQSYLNADLLSPFYPYLPKRRERLAYSAAQNQQAFHTLPCAL